MGSEDYYAILGVSRDADDATLKAAYRKLAMQHHPDRNPGNAEAEAQFKQLNAAYDVLKDPQKRAAYDQYGHAAFQQGGPGGGGGFAGGFGDIFENIFDEFLGGRRGGGRGPARGSDVRVDLELSLEEAFHGKTIPLEVPTLTPCQPCGSSGAAPGSTPKTCTTCGGAGKVRAQQGFFLIERACPTCRGAGQTIADPCKNCGGLGRVQQTRNLQVKIPAGIEDGARIRLSGEGEAGPKGAPSGDLYLFITLSPHRLFQREGSTLFCLCPLPFTIAALGGEIEVPSLDGARASVKIPAGTQTGHQFRLRGKGMPNINGASRGDLLIEVNIETPVHLNKRQKELLEEFQNLESDTNCPQSHGFFARVKELWNDLTE